MKERGLTWVTGTIKYKNTILIGGLMIIILIFVWLFLGSRVLSEREIYEKRIAELQDSINGLNERIDSNILVIDSLKVQREQTKGKIIYIERQNEKIDNWIVRSDADANIQFLSGYLSSQDDFTTR